MHIPVALSDDEEAHGNINANNNSCSDDDNEEPPRLSPQRQQYLPSGEGESDDDLEDHEAAAGGDIDSEETISASSSFQRTPPASADSSVTKKPRLIEQWQRHRSDSEGSTSAAAASGASFYQIMAPGGIGSAGGRSQLNLAYPGATAQSSYQPLESDEEESEICVTKIEPPTIVSPSQPQLQIQQQQQAQILTNSATTAPLSFAIPAQIQTPQGLITINLLIAPQASMPVSQLSSLQQQQQQQQMLLLQQQQQQLLFGQQQFLQQQQHQHQPTIANVQSVSSANKKRPAASTSSVFSATSSTASLANRAASSDAGGVVSASSSYRAEKEQLYANLLRLFEKARNRGARLIAELRQLRRCVGGNEVLIDRLAEFARALGTSDHLSSETRAELLQLLAEARECLAAANSGAAVDYD